MEQPDAHAWHGIRRVAVSRNAAPDDRSRQPVRCARLSLDSGEIDRSEHIRTTYAYEDGQLRAHAAARKGYVDEIIAPAETRVRLAAALDTFAPTDGRPVVLDELPDARVP